MAYKTNHQMAKSSQSFSKTNKTCDKHLDAIKKYKKSHPDVVKKVNDKYQATRREFIAFRNILLTA